MPRSSNGIVSSSRVNMYKAVNMYKMQKFDTKYFAFYTSPFFCTFALDYPSSSTLIHKVQLPNLLLSVILLFN